MQGTVATLVISNIRKKKKDNLRRAVRSYVARRAILQVMKILYICDAPAKSCFANPNVLLCLISLRRVPCDRLPGDSNGRGRRAKKTSQKSDYNTRDVGKGTVAGKKKKGKWESSLALSRFLHSFSLQDSTIILLLSWTWRAYN